MKFFILLLIPYTLLAGNVDSLKNQLEKTKGKLRINLLVELTKAIGRENLLEVIWFSDEALELLKKYPDKKIESEILFTRGWTYTLMNRADSARLSLNRLTELLNDFNYPKGRVLAEFLHARILRNENKYDDALIALEKAKLINENVGDNLFRIRILNEFGSVFRRQSRFYDALDMHTQALESFRNDENDNELTTTYVFLGIIHDVLGNYDKALYYHQQALELNKKKNDASGIAGSLHNIGILYQKIANYDQALKNYYEALNYWEMLKNKNGLSSTYNSIGAVNELTG